MGRSNMSLSRGRVEKRTGRSGSHLADERRRGRRGYSQTQTFASPSRTDDKMPLLEALRNIALTGCNRTSAMKDFVIHGRCVETSAIQRILHQVLLEKYGGPLWTYESLPMLDLTQHHSHAYAGNCSQTSPASESFLRIIMRPYVA